MSQVYIRLTVVFKQEEDVWTAECSELGTATFGNTFEEAHENIQEAVCLHLNTLEDVGEIEKFFRDNKIEVFTRKPRDINLSIPSQDYNAIFQHIVQPIHNPACAAYAH